MAQVGHDDYPKAIFTGENEREHADVGNAGGGNKTLSDSAAPVTRPFGLARSGLQ